MDVIFSKTGSDGNTSVISDGKTMIQIDAGVGLKKVNSQIDYRIGEIEAIFVTHGHLD